MAVTRLVQSMSTVVVYNQCLLRNECLMKVKSDLSGLLVFQLPYFVPYSICILHLYAKMVLIFSLPDNCCVVLLMTRLSHCVSFLCNSMLASMILP